MGDSLEHVIAALIPAIMVLAMWTDSRKRSRDQHFENSQRLTRIETKIGPMWKWWNRRSNGVDEEEDVET